ncbi:MAG: phage tail assembly protein [Plesiomonas sp.]|uniref:phage tail assembly protein n=1 Tax=Plesiomonas sp. TaxID=2486279 RepID=UPI003F388296
MSELTVSESEISISSTKLNKPIKAHGDTLSAVTLREPTGADVKKCGMPYQINAESEAIIIDAASVGKYISVLGGIPPSSVDELSAADFSSLSMVVVGFFGNAE